MSTDAKAQAGLGHGEGGRRFVDIGRRRAWLVVLRRVADVEERLEGVDKVLHRNNELRWGETKEQGRVQKSAEIVDELAGLEA